MDSKISATVALLAALLAIGATLHSKTLRAKLTGRPLGYPVAFQNVAEDLYRQGYLWKIPGGPRRGILVDVHVFLIRNGQDYILVDVGAPGKEYEQILGAELREAVKGGKLRWVICEPKPSVDLVTLDLLCSCES